MNRSNTCSRSYKKNKASGYRKLRQTVSGRKIIQKRRKKGRKVL